MNTPYKTYMNWSSGKDSCLALYHMLKDETFSVDTLVTTLNDELERVSMHGLPKQLLFEQVKQLSIPLHTINLPGVVSMEQYGSIMKQHVTLLKQEGYTHAAFGDIFLEDLKKYREDQLRSQGIQAVFPLWGRDSKELILEFIALGFKAITISVNDRLLGKDFVGRIIDEAFVNDLPSGVDPSGENGEFHTFVYDGPNFKDPVSFSVGEKVLKDFSHASGSKNDHPSKPANTSWDTAFWFCDLIPD
ncbi:diphthine--ammonia ligase [Robertkochia marina]|uniref:Diphthine--ammonia ligase n=1 Tax=Robertkochia marina TaxID=1227945 RepID=A0A4S3M1V9_9FLAO|nr:diphthine--ammonia ligase [Robertkochia marina]THD68007.1 diphthine--ammonia ligase [Robertkochia marina]TRZ42707.1 diphthine--ammonia ligase [Robertkochia marina]